MQCLISVDKELFALLKMEKNRLTCQRPSYSNLIREKWGLPYFKRKKDESKHTMEYIKKQRSKHQKKKRIKLKAEVFRAYMKDGKVQCWKCGFTDIRALTIDHINGNGRLHRHQIDPRGNNGSAKMYSWLKANGFPSEGYQILCFNCQWIKRFENNEWRK